MTAFAMQENVILEVIFIGLGAESVGQLPPDFNPAIVYTALLLDVFTSPKAIVNSDHWVSPLRDLIFQREMLMVIEPVWGDLHTRSCGFRPERSVSHAICTVNGLRRNTGTLGY